MSHLTVRDVSVVFAGSPPVVALDHVDLDVAEGSLVAVLGPSGCGKTTLLRVLAGLERPGAGTVELGGEPMDGDGHHVVPEHRGIGLVPQEGALFPHLDVGANIAFGLRKLPREERRLRVDELLEMVELEGLSKRRPDELSGGQQQRVALARALAPRPSMVLLDEPFSALDSGLRAEVRAEVTRVLRAAGTTAIIVTHDQAEALEIADLVAVMRSGRIMQVGPPAELYLRPVDAWVGSFLGDAITLPGTVEGSVVRCALGTLALAEPRVDGPATVFLRPEQLHRVESADATSDEGAGAQVLEVRFRGHEALVDLAIDGTRITARWAASDLPESGDHLRVVTSGPVLALDGP